MSKYKDLLIVLRNSQDNSGNDLIFLSSDLVEHKATLNKYGINYEEQAEGLKIDLSAQSIRIYKTKESAVRYLEGDNFNKDILIIEGGNLESPDIVFEAQSSKPSEYKIFENIQYFFKFKNLFITNGIVAYEDHSYRRLIFLSNKQGRLHAIYKPFWNSSFYDVDNHLKIEFQRLESKLSVNSDYIDFFRESFIEFCKAIPKEEERYSKSLSEIKHISESASRDYELYKSNFSFAEFKKEIGEDREKYLKEYQTNLSDFLSKVASMPIQFGAYVTLISIFKDKVLPLVATIILIVSWSIFKVFTVNKIIENVADLLTRFQTNLDKLVQRSGLNPADVDDEKREVSAKFRSTIILVKAYRLFVVIFTIVSLAFGFHFLISM